MNDDSEFVEPWANKFVTTLAALQPPNVGVVGPSCDQGNLEILTHDFTHRVHMEVFGDYYPPPLVDW